MPRAVAIVGMGRIGRMLAKLLLTYPAVEEQRLYSRSARPAFFEELRQANRHRQAIVAMDSPSNLGQATHVFLCFSMEYTSLVRGQQVADEWSLELTQNVVILGRMLPGWSGREARTFIVYTNPVDVLSTLLVRSLPAGNQVFGFGSSLDTLRLRSLVDERGLVLGEHGISMVPVGIGGERPVLEAARQAVIDSVRRVTLHQGYTALAPELASREFLDALCGERPAQLPLSAYAEDVGLCVGTPCQVSAWHIAPLPFHLNPAEAALWRESIAKIQSDLERTDP